MFFGQTERTMGADLTVILNSQHRVEETILFGKTAIDNTLAGVLRGSILERIPLFHCGCFLICGSRGVSISFIFNFDVDMVTVTSEWSNKSIVLILVKSVHITELFENEVIGARKVESFSWELILATIRNSCGDKIVGAKTANTSPEKKFLEVSFTCFVEQGL